MDLGKTLLDSIDFLKRSLRPDDFQKFVLPVLMSVILVLGVFSTFDLQESYGKKSLNLTLESLTEKHVLQVRDRYFPETMDRPLKNEINSIDRERRTEINDLRSRPLFMPEGLLSRMIFESGAFPLVPERTLAPWNPEKDYVRAVGLLRYRNNRISGLGEKTGSSYSYPQFQSDVAIIRSKSYEREEVQAFVRNNSSDEGFTLSFLEDVSVEKIISNGVDSISFSDFLPSFFTTFVFYYLLGALSVQANKEVVEKVFDQNSQVDSFSR